VQQGYEPGPLRQRLFGSPRLPDRHEAGRIRREATARRTAAVR